MVKLPRWLHRAYAVALGYFWLPCPICGECFGGHEVGPNNGTLITELGEWGSCSMTKGVVTCADPRCAAEAEKRSADQ